MHRALLLSLLLLASCAGHQEGSISSQRPSLSVADVALANGAPDTALHIAQATLATDPNNVPALVRAGKAQTALDQQSEARHSFNRALALAPSNPDAAIGLARLELKADPAAAADVLLRLTDRDPHNVPALIDLGIAKDLLGRHVEAQQAYRHALALEPDNIAGQVNLGLSLALSGDSQQAVRILRPVAGSASASSRMRQDLAVALALAGHDDEAASALRSDVPRQQAAATVAGYHLLQGMP